MRVKSDPGTRCRTETEPEAIALQNGVRLRTYHALWPSVYRIRPHGEPYILKLATIMGHSTDSTFDATEHILEAERYLAQDAV